MLIMKSLIRVDRPQEIVISGPNLLLSSQKLFEPDKVN